MKCANCGLVSFDCARVLLGVCCALAPVAWLGLFAELVVGKARSGTTTAALSLRDLGENSGAMLGPPMCNSLLGSMSRVGERARV